MRGRSYVLCTHGAFVGGRVQAGWYLRGAFSVGTPDLERTDVLSKYAVFLEYAGLFWNTLSSKYAKPKFMVSGSGGEGVAGPVEFDVGIDTGEVREV